MVPLLVVTVVILAVLGAAVSYARRNRREPDDIDSFRRQIDALSPEARRQTSDRMNPSERRATGDDGAGDS